jgi:hypothetical protein
VQPNVRRAFEEIARAGRGKCVTIEDEQKIIRQMLSLALGYEFRDDIDKVFDSLNSKDANRGGMIGKFLSRKLEAGDVSWIRSRFDKAPVPSWIVGILCDCKDRNAARELYLILRDPKVPDECKRSALFACCQILGLSGDIGDVETMLPRIVRALRAR